jgi:hypothetical protein
LVIDALGGGGNESVDFGFDFPELFLFEGFEHEG